MYVCVCNAHVYVYICMCIDEREKKMTTQHRIIEIHRY